MNETDPLAFYVAQGPMSDPRQFAELFNDLPTDISSLCQVVQGLLLHVFWAERYGVHLTAEQKEQVNLRSVAQMLACIRASDPRPLTEPRPAPERLVGNCRHFSLLLTSMLRHQGVPARARCGFGTYFLPDHYEDHWVCEYWSAAEKRWVTVDAQLDALQRQTLQIGFNTYDMPPNQFVPGGQAWQLCRAGQADPERFGIFEMHGMWFIRGDLVRDFASLTKIELLPWDSWGLIDKDEKEVTEEDRVLLDHAARLTLAGNAAFAELRALYENDPRLRVPPVIRTYLDDGPQTIALAELQTHAG